MKIGVPKEIKNNEFRVALTPTSVQILVDQSHDVYVQASAGNGIGFTDEDPLINVSTTKLSDSENFETSWMIGSFPKYANSGAEIGVRWFDFFRSTDIYGGIQHLDGTTSVRLKFEGATSSGRNYVGFIANTGDGSVAAIWGISISSLLASATGLASYSTGSIKEPTSLKGLRRTELASYWRRDFFKD